MSGEWKNALQKRLDDNYAAFMESLQGKTVSELIAMAPEITAAQQLHEELLDTCDEEDAAFLLRFDNPLEIVKGYWEVEISGYDHSGEMGHMLWSIREDMENDAEQGKKTPFTKDEITVDPDMDFSGEVITAYIEIWFDVGRRFQVYPNIDDSCDLYAEYDPVTQTLHGELCIKTYDGKEQWEPVEFLPSEQKLIVESMEEICRKDMGKSLRDAWADGHPAVNKGKLHGKKNWRSQHER